METEEDMEVLWEGGQLHKYMTETLKKDVNMFCVLENNYLQQENHDKIATQHSRIRVQAETKNLVDIILNSSQMLDEDACLLNSLSQKFDVHFQYLNCKTFASFASTMISGWVSLFFERSRALLLPILASSTFVFGFYLRRLYSYTMLDQQITVLCNNLKLAHLTLKKRYNYLQQNISCITTKEILSRKMIPKDISNNMYNLTRIQLKLSAHELTSDLLELLNCLKISSQCLLQIRIKMPSDTRYIAEMSDEELGINKVIDNLLKEQFTLTNIEMVRHLMIILQSEFLRILGFSLFKITKTFERRKLLEVVRRLNKCLERIITTKTDPLAFYKKQKPIILKNKEKGFDDKGKIMASVQALRLHLHSVIVEVCEIEDLICNNDLSAKEANLRVEVGLNDISYDIREFDFHFQKVKKLLGKTHDSSVNGQSVVLPLQKKTVETGIEVGKSDFSIKSNDEVFFGVSDYEEGFDCLNRQDYEEDEPPTDKRLAMIYDRVIAEVKVAIESKRTEFAERELMALQKNSNYQSYIDFQKESDNINSNCTKENVDDEFDDNVPKNLNINFHKCLANEAVNKSLQLKFISSEETSFEA